MAIYNGKHCVFEMVGVESSSFQWNPASNKDADNCYNNWNISKMRNTTLPAHLLLLSSALQDNLTTTTIQTATNGNNGTLVSTSDKLFLAAEKEMKTSPNMARTEENNALTTWGYWTTHTTSSDRIKYNPTSTAQSYWLRSPYTGATIYVVYVGGDGGFNGRNADLSLYVSPCFAF